MKIEIKTENGKLKKIFARCSFIYYNKNVRIQEFSNDIRFREIIAQTALESWEKKRGIKYDQKHLRVVKRPFCRSR